MPPELTLNLWTAWAGILSGILSGSLIGLFFRRDSWLGGYSAFPRRMLRLGHIACFGIAFLNLAFVLTASHTGGHRPLHAPAYLFAAANLLMPAVCFLSAWRRGFAHLFPLPVACVLIASVLFIRECWTPWP